MAAAELSGVLVSGKTFNRRGRQAAPGVWADAPRGTPVPGPVKAVHAFWRVLKW